MPCCNACNGKGTQKCYECTKGVLPNGKPCPDCLGHCYIQCQTCYGSGNTGDDDDDY